MFLELFLFAKKDEILCLMRDRNPEFLKSEIGSFSDFKRKSYLMDLKSAYSQESDFQERSGSLENGICVTWSGFWLCPGYLWLLIDLDP